MDEDVRSAWVRGKVSDRVEGESKARRKRERRNKVNQGDEREGEEARRREERKDKKRSCDSEAVRRQTPSRGDLLKLAREEYPVANVGLWHQLAPLVSRSGTP